MMHKRLAERRLWELVAIQKNIENTIKYCVHTAEVKQKLSEDLERILDMVEIANEEYEEVG